MYSHSRISAFEQCPLKYRYAYVDRIRTGITPVEFFLGSRAHDALEHLYKCRLHGKLLTEEETLAFFEKKWEGEWNDNIVIRKKEFSAEDYRNVAREGVRDYYRRYRPFDEGKVMGIEKRIVVDLDPGGEGRYKLQGYIDRLDRKEGGLFEIHDYKTSASLPTQAEADRDRQLALYEIGLRDMFSGVEEVKLVWHYLRFDAEIRSGRTPSQLRKLCKGVVGRIDEIEDAVEKGSFPARESALCGWCEFQEICPQWRHLFETKKLEPEARDVEDGTALVNSLAGIREELRKCSALEKELRAEKKRLEEALQRFAREKGVDRVFGDEFEAAVREKTALKVPTKTHEPEEYAELVELVRESEYWSRISDLSRRKLEKFLQTDEAGRLPGRVRDLVKEETKTTVSLRKRRDQGEGGNA